MLTNYLPRPSFYLPNLLLRLDTYWIYLNVGPQGSFSNVLGMFLGTWVLYKLLFYTPRWVRYEEDDEDNITIVVIRYIRPTLQKVAIISTIALTYKLAVSIIPFLILYFRLI